MMFDDQATFIVNAVSMEESICRPTATWMFKDSYERVDVERYCVSIQVLEVKSSSATCHDLPLGSLWRFRFGQDQHVESRRSFES